MAEGASGKTISTAQHVVDAALSLLTLHGRDAVSTRAVCAAAGVQAPTIYRIFGDKRGLLDAVAAQGMASHLRAHHDRPGSHDPVQDLRHGWDVHVAFGLANPYLYSLIYGEPRPGRMPPGALDGTRHVAALVRAVAVAGRLVVDQERAVHLLVAAGTGTVLTLVAAGGPSQDLSLSHLARETVITAITTQTPAPRIGLAGAAISLMALLNHTSALSAGEQQLLGEWLDRIARQDP